MLTNHCDLDAEIQRRIGLAAASFGKLSTRVFYNQNLRLHTRVKVYKAICLSILLYGCESWVPCRRHIKALEGFHMRCIMRIMGLKLWDKVPHVAVRQRANIDPIECIMAQRNLRWIGHVHKMSECRLPRQVFNSELVIGNRLQGTRWNCYKYHISSV